MPKNIFLTGATGFLGSSLLEALINNHYNVTVLLRKTSNIWRIQHLINSCKCIIENDIQNFYDDIFKDQSIDTVIHTATEYGRAKDISSIITSNVILPLTILEAGLRNDLKHFINTDSFFSKPIYETNYLGNYIKSKKIILDILIQFSQKIKIDNIRIEHIFGKNDAEGKFIPYVLNQLINNNQILELTEGKQKRDFIYLPDVVQAFIKVLENKNKTVGFTEYEAGLGDSISVKEFIKKLATAVNSNTELKFGSINMRDDEIMDSKADISKLKAIGWIPQFSIDDAIKNLLLPN